MPFLVALLGIAVSAYFLFQRSKRGAEMTHDIVDVAQDVRAAARRFGFKRKTNVHPVEGIDDPNLAISGLACAFLELDDLPTSDARRTMDIALRKHLDVDAQTAAELAILGRWFVEQCNGASPAFTRLAKRLNKIDSGASFNVLMSVLGDIAGAGSAPTPSTRQSEALTDLARVFRLS